MRTLGLIGGMSWESTVPYYRLINEAVKERLGGFHSARIVLYSVDFHEIEHLQRSGDWAAAGRLLAQAGVALHTAGAEGLVLCTNTMHKVASAIERAVAIPLLHIADATGEDIRHYGLATVGLLGTRFTMEEDFYSGRLRERHGLEVVIPGTVDRELIHRVIYDELCLGKVLDPSRGECQKIMQRLVDRGAQGVILGCTELSLLVGAKDAPVPVFDTTGIHARRAAEWALEDNKAVHHQ
ncbi:MAG: aspartate/glutamate racemase family protein [Acidiferrobacterales bacterium]